MVLLKNVLGKIVCSDYIFLKVHHHFNQLDAVQGQSEKLNKQLRGFVTSYNISTST